MIASVATSVGISPAPAPLMKRVPMPVDMRPIKEALVPIYQDMVDWMEPARRHASQGLQAMKMILEGDDFIPARGPRRGWEASRRWRGRASTRTPGGAAFQGATRNVNQGVAANIVGNCRRRSTVAVARAAEQPGMALSQL
jgi:hypothetical protein